MPVDVLVSPGRLIQWTTDLKLNHIKYEVIIDDVPAKIKAQRLPASSNRLTVREFDYAKYNTYEDASIFCLFSKNINTKVHVLITTHFHFIQKTCL